MRFSTSETVDDITRGIDQVVAEPHAAFPSIKRVVFEPIESDSRDTTGA